jgi:hypothetical protein
MGELTDRIMARVDLAELRRQNDSRAADWNKGKPAERTS